MDTVTELFGEPIFSYTRKQALEDGVLVDLSVKAPDVCKRSYKYPVACTAEVWAIIEKAAANKRHGQSVEGILHDVFFMSRVCSRAQPRGESDRRRIFRVTIKGAGRQSVFDLKMECGPGDDLEPVMTLMLRDQD